MRFIIIVLLLSTIPARAQNVSFAASTTRLVRTGPFIPLGCNARGRDEAEGPQRT
jgi:hypothetical protein